MDEKIIEMFAQLLQGQTETNSKIENLSQKIESLEENQLRLERINSEWKIHLIQKFKLYLMDINSIRTY